MYDHNEYMRKMWIDTIEDKDIILHLGDVFFNGEWHHDLPGEKYFIRGNHDSHYRIEDLQSRGWTLIEPFTLGNVMFSHYPKSEVPDDMFSIHGHIHQNPPPTKRHINISVERTDYKPVWLGDIWNIEPISNSV